MAESGFLAIGGVSNVGVNTLLTLIDSKVKQNTAASTFVAPVGGVSSFDPSPPGGFDPNDLAITNSKIKLNDPINCSFVDPACAT